MTVTKRSDASTNTSLHDNSMPAPIPSLAALRSRSPWYYAWRQFRRDKAAMAGVAVLLLVLALTAFSPLIAPYDPLFQSSDREDRLAPPSAEHPLGTDDLRRDMLSRILHGGQTTIRIGFVSVAGAMTVGLLVGISAGFYGGWVDQVIGRVLDVVLTLPGILLAIVIVAILGAGLQNAMLAIAVSAIPVFARVARGATLSEKNKVYVDCAHATGATNRYLMLRHILPNVFPPVAVLGTLYIATAIQVAAGLSFLGLGAQPPHPEWGAMLSQGRDYMRTGEWWMTVFPGMAIFITVMAINLVGDGLRDALDPRLHR
jgi:ABC-type dipeptide/oligopeptide/nickel transport system permease subunit